MGRKSKLEKNGSAHKALQDRLVHATSLQHSGSFAAAEREYRNILKQSPNHSDALQFLAILLQQMGKHSSALHYMQQALKSSPNNPQIITNQAEIFRVQGNFENARILAEQAIVLQADNVDALVILGSIDYIENQSESAIALFSKAINIKPDDASIHNELANALCLFGDYQKAKRHYLTGLSLQPEFDECRINLADTLFELEQLGQSIEQYLNVLERQPENINLRVKLANAYQKKGAIKDALSVLNIALALDSASMVVKIELGKLLQVEDPIAATGYFLSVIEKDKDNAEALYWLGILSQTMGKFDQANSYLQKAIETDPSHVNAWYRLSLNRDFEVSNEQISQLQNRFDEQCKNNPTNQHLVNLGYSLGRFNEQKENYAASFKYYQFANQLKSKAKPFDRNRFKVQIDHIIEIFNDDFFSSRQNWGSDSNLPIFIIGMPRSGTSLVEQILTSHPIIHGAGELPLILEVAESQKPFDANKAQSHASQFQDLSQQRVEQIAAQCLKDLSDINPLAAHIIDKMPGNFFRLGIIGLLFPQARIIHCKRDPIDTCLSCYQQNFKEGLVFTNDLEDLAHAYRDYLRLMDHWHQVLPEHLLDVEYESLITEPENQIQKLLSFCGVEWDSKVLDFHQQQRPVSTASLWQVRQPIYKSSIGRWKHYQEFLESLQKELSN